MADAPRYERTRKESPLETIYYEIDMSEFAFGKLGAHSGGAGPEWNLLIEGFFMHYRNAISFFSGKKHRAGDISTKEPEVFPRPNSYSTIWKNPVTGKPFLKRLKHKQDLSILFRN